MRNSMQPSSADLPLTSFPSLRVSAPDQELGHAKNSPIKRLLEEIQHILIISDARDCNSNLSLFLKISVDHLKTQEETYHTCSFLALRLLNSNLFIKNYELCLGKILGLMELFSQSVAGDCFDESGLIKEILSIIMLLLFKLYAEEYGPSTLSDAIQKKEILSTLRELTFIDILARFITGHITNSESSHASYVILNFTCNIFFQYLYHMILLSDSEFESLTNSLLLPTLIDDLLSNDNFNDYKYDLAGQEFEDVTKLIAYEEFKLLLLINEQYMMTSTSSNLSDNKVIEEVRAARKDSGNGICGFINLLVYHMNREESHIIRIQMLKFLFLILSSTKFCKTPYLNDLKILVDIIIRELDDLDYSSDKSTDESRFLALTYLKILHPLLSLTQLNDLTVKYKAPQLVEVLSNVIMNCDLASTTKESKCDDELSVGSTRSILRAATRCLLVPWLRSPKKQSLEKLNYAKLPNLSSDSLTSASSLTSRVTISNNQNSPSSGSTDSFSVSRVASVRTSAMSDYTKHTTKHNLTIEKSEPENIFAANNQNVFRSNATKTTHPDHSNRISKHENMIGQCPSSAQTLGLLNLPREYLSNKALPELPRDANSPFDNVLGMNKLQEKAKLKKAPPPPPPPSRMKRQVS